MTGTSWGIRQLARPLAACALVAGAVTGMTTWADGWRDSNADNRAGGVAVKTVDAEATLSRTTDGSARLSVVERVTVDGDGLRQSDELRRLIPGRLAGSVTPVRLLAVEVPGQGSADYRAETTDEGLLVTVPLSPGGADREIVFRYERDDTVAPGADGEQRVAWEVPGALSATPVERVTGRLRVDDTLGSNLVRAESCTTERSSDSQPCTVTSDDLGSPVEEDITATAQRVAGHDSMTVDVDVRTGTFSDPEPDPDGAAGRTALLLVGGGSAAAAGAAGLLAATRRRRASIVITPEGRLDPEAGAPSPEVPAGLTPALAGSLVRQPGRGIVAQLLDAATKGNVRLRTGDHDVLVELVAWPEELSRVDDAALSVLVPRVPQPPQSLAGRARLAGAEPLEVVRDAAERARLVNRPDAHRGGRRLAVAAAASSVAVPWLAHSHEIGFVPGAATLAVVLGSMGAGHSMLRRWQSFTPPGRESVRGLEQLGRYLTSPRDQRLAALREAHSDGVTPADEAAHYERLLPWAVVLGVEDRWLATVTEMHGSAPAWLADGQLADLVAAIRESDIVEQLEARLQPPTGAGTAPADSYGVTMAKADAVARSGASAGGMDGGFGASG